VREVGGEVEDGGGTFVGEITEDRAVPKSYFEDPDGNTMYLVEERGGDG
jgi:hypothetical protein